MDLYYRTPLQYIVLRSLLIILVLSFFIPVAAQRQEKIDSLKSLLPGKTDEERADIFYELAYEYVDFNDQLGAQYGEKSFQLAKKIGDSLRMVKAGRIQATAFRRLERLDSAISLGLEILPIASRNHYGKEIKQILRGVALAYTYKANYDLGLRYNFELLKATEQDRDSMEMSYVLNNIGLIYYKLLSFEKALHYYRRALDVRSPLDKYPRTGTFVNISLCYSSLKDFSKANEFLKKGLDSCYPECRNFMIEVLQARGKIYLLKGDLDSAEVNYLQSYSFAKELGNKRFQLIMVSELTAIYLQRNQISMATKCLSEAESIIQQSPPFGLELIQQYAKFSTFYKKNGSDKRRAFCQEKYIQLMDSIYNQRLTSNLMKIESEYLERSNKVRITEQEELLVLKDQVIARQKTFNILTGIMTALLVALLYVLYRSNLQRKSANRLLDQKVKERTAALELSQLALRQSLEEKDLIITRAFYDIKSSTTTIKGLCSSGLEDEPAVEIRKRLEKIWAMTGHVSRILSKIHAIEI